MHNQNYVPKDYVPVPGEANGSTFKSIHFNRPDRTGFWVSNRFLRYDAGTYYMPASMVAHINRSYRVTGTVTRTGGRTGKGL